MTSTPRYTTRVLALVLLATGALGAEARIKCWTNDEGVRECGDRLPPEYAQKRHEEVSNQGVVVEEHERALTDEELDEKREREREQAETERLARERARQDRVLLDTYSSVDDIKLSRDGKIAGIESQIKLAQSQLEKLEKNLDEIIANAAEMERRGIEPPQRVQEDIDNVKQQIRRKEAFIESKREEKAQVREEYQDYIVRFTELTENRGQ